MPKVILAKNCRKKAGPLQLFLSLVCFSLLYTWPEVLEQMILVLLLQTFGNTFIALTLSGRKAKDINNFYDDWTFQLRNTETEEKKT